MNFKIHATLEHITSKYNKQILFVTLNQLIMKSACKTDA